VKRSLKNKLSKIKINENDMSVSLIFHKEKMNG